MRYRAKLVNIAANLKAQVHAVLAKEGVRVDVSDLFGVAGTAQLDQLELAAAYKVRVDSLRDILAVVTGEIDMLGRRVDQQLAGHRGYRAIQAIPGVGPVLASVFVAEIGDVSRFPGPRQLCSWAGLTPRHRESDTTVRRGHITKQGSRLVRWATIEAVAHQRDATPIREHHRRVAERRGKGIGRVAAARKLLTLVYYGLRDGEIRCLAETA